MSRLSSNKHILTIPTGERYTDSLCPVKASFRLDCKAKLESCLYITIRGACIAGDIFECAACCLQRTPHDQSLKGRSQPSPDNHTTLYQRQALSFLACVAIGPRSGQL